MKLIKLAALGLACASLSFASVPAFAEGESAGHGDDEHHDSGHHELMAPAGGWSFEGFTGTFDQNALQRGYKVYQEVCASCHGMSLMSFRNLGQEGGPFYDSHYPNPNDNPKVKKIASDYFVTVIDPETGDELQEPAKTSDAFPEPYPNEGAARGGNGGSVPPDLSVMAKARIGGASYIYSLLLGYPEHPPENLTVSPGQHFNTFFHGDTSGQWAGDPRLAPAGGFLAMAPPLTTTGQVEYDDGTVATVEQMAADVTTFIAWASEPKQTTRKQMGLSALIYLFIMALLVYASYRHIWRNVDH